MRATLLGVAFLLGGFTAVSAHAASVCNAVIGNIVKNCGFEAGNLSDWNVSGNLEGGTSGNYFGVTGGLQNSGTYAAYFGVQGGGGSDIGSLGPFLALSQSFPLLRNEYYSFTFYLEDLTAPNPGYTQYFDASINGFQVVALDNSSIDSNLIGSYRKFSFVTSTGGQFGAAPDISFDFQNDDSYWLLDDVSVTALGPTPEPASFLLVAPALAGLFWFVRRRAA